jgi:hypothetical protein
MFTFTATTNIIDTATSRRRPAASRIPTRTLTRRSATRIHTIRISTTSIGNDGDDESAAAVFFEPVRARMTGLARLDH